MNCPHRASVPGLSKTAQGGDLKSTLSAVVLSVAAFPIGFLLIVLFAGCESEPPAQYGRLNSEARYLDSYEEMPAKEDLVAKVLSSSDQQAQLQQEIGRQFSKFIQTIKRQVRDGESSSATTPAWVSQSFASQSVQWDSFKPRFDDPSIKISRWQASSESPKFEGEKAFTSFVTDYFKRWSQAKNFRIEIKPYSTRPLPDSESTIETKAVVEVFGHTQSGVGLQVTSLWTTQWNKAESDGPMELSAINVRAQEQVELEAPRGQLFEDYTESILGRTKLLDEQLSFGLDQWARKIPGLDIVGHHGLSTGDVNQDGLDDIYVCQPHGLPNLLLIQNPDGTVEDMGKQAGVDILDESRGSLMIDVDNDGDQDLVVTTDQGLVLMSNKGKGDFQLEHQLEIGHGGHSVSAADL